MVRDFLLGLSRDAWASVLGWPIWKKIFVAISALLLMLIVLYTDIDVSTLRAWSDQAGAWFPILFFALYIGITQFPIPRTVFTLSAGVLFGPGLGIVIALVATTLSAALSLTIVRGLLGQWMRPRLNHPAVSGIDARLRQRGWLAVLSLRMIAGVPFSILNYVAALTSIRLLPFAFATAVGSAPGTIATVVFGAALTGDANPAVLIVTVVLCVLGIIGLTLDARLPVKTSSTQGRF
ncbi:TVP38/TMEM64 family protein [Corynebacterium freiburgense]|uniref:TVP38/TMEM64 family protein n=1 Tax=Corynebacterium freiburgense TaxID=556548 RepID=UPI00041BD014|nr:TVP38/TMEM64 family protein [Corynebacterium freiburgense]WJZ02675.1 TVP38/TMEM64 family inner membrane protein YdjZ [Corynebacterium freiburgense]